VRGHVLAAQASHCRQHISTSFLAWSQEYRCRTLFGFYWHPGDLLTVHRADRSACPPLCSEEELFGLNWIVLWRNPSYALVRRFLQRAISTGPSSFCMWDSGRWCLSTPFVGRFLLLAEWALCLCRLAAPFSEPADPSRLRLGLKELVLALCLTGTRPCYNAYILLGRAVLRGHRHFCVSGLCDVRN
jgi:hypothetical protein